MVVGLSHQVSRWFVTQQELTDAAIEPVFEVGSDCYPSLLTGRGAGEWGLAMVSGERRNGFGESLATLCHTSGFTPFIQPETTIMVGNRLMHSSQGMAWLYLGV